MASSESDFVQKLIAQSKNLAAANVKKCQNESTFKELTLFKNLSNFCTDKKSETDKFGLNQVFNITVQVYPSPLRLNPLRCNETMTIIIENISKSFSFSPDHWQFLIDINSGEEISNSWNLESDLNPGKSESFSSSFYTNPSISPVEIRICIIFSIIHSEKTFSTTLPVYKSCIDILHLITPSRYPRTDMHDPVHSLDPILPLFPPVVNSVNSKKRSSKQVDTDQEEEEIEEELPAITQFFFKLCPNLMASFLSQILLKDCKCRWLNFKSETDISTLIRDSPQTFPIYYLEEEILVVLKPSSGTIAFKSINPKVLCALKLAILRRFANLGNNIHVVQPDDATCEKLYALRLRLEEVSKPAARGEVQVRDFVNFYLDLRDISETIEFSGSSVARNNSEIEVIEL